MQPTTAQQNHTNIAGTYFMQGVVETASVFDLKPDSTFEFFFSQGALDRGGSGRWSVKNDRVVFNSTNIRPAKDYALVTSKTIPGNETIVKMVDKNTMILSYSEVTLKTPTGISKGKTSSSGELELPKKNATEIVLLFQLCPDRQSVFTVNSAHNYFEFRLEPWVGEVFFKNFSLALHDKLLSGAHPMLDGSEFSYEREK